MKHEADLPKPDADPIDELQTDAATGSPDALRPLMLDGHVVGDKGVAYMPSEMKELRLESRNAAVILTHEGIILEGDVLDLRSTREIRINGAVVSIN